MEQLTDHSNAERYECRTGCGACCIALSISSPIPGLPHGKPAGVRCPHLELDSRCAIYGKPERPQICAQLRPEPLMCGSNFLEAMQNLTLLEALTCPA